jgi:hypothetical protein
VICSGNLEGVTKSVTINCSLATQLLVYHRVVASTSNRICADHVVGKQAGPSSTGVASSSVMYWPP